MTDKERLEEIKNSYLVGVHIFFGTPWVSMPKENCDWLIEQAEHRQRLLERLNKRGIEIKKLKNQLSCCREKIKKSEWSRLVLKGTAEQVMRSSRSNYELANKLKAENKRLREALEFYADSKNWLPQNDDVLSEITMDYGSKAKQALEGDEN